MPETRLILHVKGTESETTELPKDAVRTAISQGQITQSQLIWSTADNAWKQVKDLPDLLPAERLILHVKGTEAETKELPKQAVREGISQGTITHSQLIWSVPESAWKQVKEMPDLLTPADRLILHVKGTEAETKELSKQAIRTAISKGQISHSQLIWSTADNAWKQVREMPELLPSQKLAPAPAPTPSPHVPKVVEAFPAETTGSPVPRAAKATPHALTAEANVPQVHAGDGVSAKPRVRVTAPPVIIPKVHVSVAPSQPVPVPTIVEPAAEPQVRVATEATPRPQVHAVEVPGAAPQVRVAAAANETPQSLVAPKPVAAAQVRVVAAAVPVVQARVPEATYSSGSHVVKEEDESHPLKWVCIALGALIILVFGGNYLLVDQPLASNLKQTSYPNVAVFAHLGAFVQPGVMVIHISTTSKITPDNLVDFLVALAHSTPLSPITSDLYNRVAITSGWTAQYSFSGGDWKELGDMAHESAAERKDFLLSKLGDASGLSLMPASTLNESAREVQREKVWDALAAHFAVKQ